MVEPSHLEKLVDISHCCGIELQPMMVTYTRKAIQFAERERKDLSFSPEQKHYDRSIRVMEKYANKYHNYTETWIE